jgi:predicted nucleic acid-binding protein
MDRVLADTGVWYEMFDPRRLDADEIREIRKKAEILDFCRLVVPWPTLYETLRSRMVNNRIAMQLMENYLKRPNLEYVDDAPYREEALKQAFSWCSRGRPLGMVDCLIRLVLDDIKIKIDVLATVDPKDFVDVCRKKRIEII